jgi:hypothetical protein
MKLPFSGALLSPNERTRSTSLGLHVEALGFVLLRCHSSNYLEEVFGKASRGVLHLRSAYFTRHTARLLE